MQTFFPFHPFQHHNSSKKRHTSRQPLIFCREAEEARSGVWKEWVRGLTGVELASKPNSHRSRKYQPLSRLSPDHITFIFSHLQLKDFPSILRANRLFRAIGEQVLLYGHPNVPDIAKSPKRLRNPLFTLASRPDFAAYVRYGVLASSYIPDRRRQNLDSDWDHSQEEVHNSLELRVLRQLSNLTCLKIVSGFTTRDKQEQEIRHTVNTQYKLRLFQFSRRLTYTTSSPDLRGVVEMLRSQRDLIHLELRTSEDVDFSEGDRSVDLTSHMPNLKSFVGRPWTASQIVPGRPVTKLGLLVGNEDFEDGSGGNTSIAFARVVKGSTKPILELELEYGTVDVTKHGVLKDLAQSMPSVEVLRVHIAPDIESKHKDDVFALIEEVRQSMRYMPNLKVIDLSGNCMPCPQHKDVLMSRTKVPLTPQQLATVSSWSEANDTLQVVRLANGKEWKKYGG